MMRTIKRMGVFLGWLIAGHVAAVEEAPDKADAGKAVPEGFEVQVMEPTGGRILKPEGWFYVEAHREHAYMWTLSKEDPKGGAGHYDTGVRIQAFVGIGEASGKTPEAFVRGFLDQKKKAADEVHESCEPSKGELFTRICLETTEGDYRILYSMFWGNEIDVAVVSIAGAKKDEWEKYTKTFDTMAEFELIDMGRFAEDPDGDEATEEEKSPEE